MPDRIEIVKFRRLQYINPYWRLWNESRGQWESDTIYGEPPPGSGMEVGDVLNICESGVYRHLRPIKEKK
jgi:hypothetical protein